MFSTCKSPSTREASVGPGHPTPHLVRFGARFHVRRLRPSVYLTVASKTRVAHTLPDHNPEGRQASDGWIYAKTRIRSERDDPSCVWNGLRGLRTHDVRSMHHDANVIVVGAGLAGACAALALSPHGDVRVLEAETPASGASGAAAGLVNPFMGRRARPVWQLREALQAVTSLVEEADARDLFPPHGMLRPVMEEEQEAPFRAVAEEYPDLATWLTPAQVHAQYPDVNTSLGALSVERGGAIDVPAFVKALLNAAENHGATVETNTPIVYWRETPTAAIVEVGRGADTEELRADRVLLALGQGYTTFPELRRLGLEGVKGQTVRVRRPDSLSGPLLPLSGRGYVVPMDEDTLVLGSNYDNNFDDLTPDPDATAYIRDKTSKMVSGVDKTEILGVDAGVRVKHESTNLPILGPMPGRTRIWTFTALGSKGLLTAPLLSQYVPTYLHDPTSIPEAVQIPT